MPNYKLLEGFSTILPQEAIVPSRPEDISEGDYVKIGVSTNVMTLHNAYEAEEKFWGIVYAIDRDNWKFGVRINQDLKLIRYHGLSDGDELILEFKHIVAVIK